MGLPDGTLKADLTSGPQQLLKSARSEAHLGKSNLEKRGLQRLLKRDFIVKSLKKDPSKQDYYQNPNRLTNSFSQHAVRNGKGVFETLYV